MNHNSIQLGILSSFMNRIVDFEMIKLSWHDLNRRSKLVLGSFAEVIAFETKQLFGIVLVVDLNPSLAFIAAVVAKNEEGVVQDKGINVNRCG